MLFSLKASRISERLSCCDVRDYWWCVCRCVGYLEFLYTWFVSQLDASSTILILNQHQQSITNLYCSLITNQHQSSATVKQTQRIPISSAYYSILTNIDWDPPIIFFSFSSLLLFFGPSLSP